MSSFPGVNKCLFVYHFIYDIDLFHCTDWLETLLLQGGAKEERRVEGGSPIWKRGRIIGRGFKAHTACFITDILQSVHGSVILWGFSFLTSVVVLCDFIVWLVDKIFVCEVGSHLNSHTHTRTQLNKLRAVSILAVCCHFYSTADLFSWSYLFC